MTASAATASGQRSIPKPIRRELKRLGGGDPVRGNRMVENVFLELCSLSKTALGYRAAQAWEARDYDALTSLVVDPFYYDWVGLDREFDTDYQIACFFKKFQGFDLGIDKEELAYKKWVKAEESCKSVNQYFRSRWEGGTEPLPFHVEEVLHLARRKIARILGTVKRADMELIREESRHGPGGDLDVRRDKATAYEKFRTFGSITEPCQRLYDVVFGSEWSPYPARGEGVASESDSETASEDASRGPYPDVRHDFADGAPTVIASRLSFVSKTARIDRAICVEPRWNVFIQLGIGALISKRLRRFGQDVKSQAPNQLAASKAYDNGFSTIDLSSASDTIATNLVVDLLADADPMWLDLLLLSRCAYVKYRGRVIRLEKISSMGNGYTFPLETLIFYALASAAVEFSKLSGREVHVYGDDIVIPRGAFSLTVEVLQAMGFSVNTDKSYANGSFYESCGKDFYRGREVRPLFLKESVLTLSQAYIFHNQIVAWAGTGLAPGFFSRERLDLTRCVLRELSTSKRLYGPRTIGGVLHAPFDVWCHMVVPSRETTEWGWEGWFVDALIPVASKEKRWSYKGHLYSKLSQGLQCGNWVQNPGDQTWRVEKVLVTCTEDFTLV